MVSATVCRMRGNIGKQVTLIRPHVWKSKHKKTPELNETGIIKGAGLSRHSHKPAYTIYWGKSKSTWEKLESEVRVTEHHELSLNLTDNASLVEPNTSVNSLEAHRKEDLSKRKEYVYVVETKIPGYFYVGKSANPDERIRQHNQGSGSEFCKVHGGIARRVQRLTPETDNACIDEQQELLAQMLKHGFNNVRGWEFINAGNLTAVECDNIKTLVVGSGDLCRNCGGSGHFYTECSSEKKRWLEQLEAIKQDALDNDENEAIPQTSKEVLQQLVN